MAADASGCRADFHEAASSTLDTDLINSFFAEWVDRIARLTRARVSRGTVALAGVGPLVEVRADVASVAGGARARLLDPAVEQWARLNR